MTVQEVFNNFIAQIGYIYSERESISITKIIFEDIFNITLYNSSKPFIHEDKIDPILSQLKEEVPVQYIIGFTYFFGYKFYVSKDVLIPRQETEELVDIVSKYINNWDTNNLNVLDIGTGSGCIPISLSLKCPDVNIYASDISNGALKMAAQNAKHHNQDVTFIKNDILDKSQWQDFEEIHNVENFDVIISNPPYIPNNEKSLMSKNVLEYEPHLALFVKNEEPLVFYQVITEFSGHYLKKGGRLIFEVNEFNAKDVVEILDRNSFEKVEIIQDISDKDRIVSAYKK